MPAVSTLNVRITASVTEFNKALKRMERDLRFFGMRMSRIGMEMTTSLTLPIAAFGAKAVQAAGDIEALRLALETTFKSAGRSVEEARKELEALRIVALQPGIDFEQAVRGSIRLQNVGYSAEAARAILVELANAIALTGGSAIELDGVTRQFAQVIAKGRILQEDLTIIQENMPAIGQALKNAFGTSSAERLRELGVTTEQLIASVIIELNKLPRVQGGIKNAIVNFFATLKIEMAAFGEAINRAINIEETGNKILGFLKSVRVAFEGLPNSAQKFIVYFASGLAVIGPLIKIIGGLALTFGRLIDVVKLFGNTVVNIFGIVSNVVVFLSNNFTVLLKKIVATQVGTKIIASFQAAYAAASAGVIAFTNSVRAAAVAFFNATAAAIGFRAAVIAATLGVAAIIAGIVSAVMALASAFNSASKSQEVFKEGQQQIIQQFVQEEASIKKSFDVLKNYTVSIEERRKAIEDIKNKYPDYIKGIDLEKASLSELDKIQKEVTANSLKRIALQQRESALLKYREKEVELLRKISDAQTRPIGLGESLAGGRSAVLSRLQKELEDLRKEAREVDASFSRVFGLGVYGAKTFSEAIGNLGETAQNTNVLIRKIDLAAPIQSSAAEAREAGSDYAKTLESLLKTGTEVSKVSSGTEKSTKRMRNALADVTAGLRAFDERLRLQGESYDFLQDKARFLEQAIQKLLKAGFSSASEEVIKLNDELADLNNRIENEINTYKKLRDEWSKPVRIPEPVIPDINVRGILTPLEQGLKEQFDKVFGKEKTIVYSIVKNKKGEPTGRTVKRVIEPPKIESSEQISALIELEKRIDVIREKLATLPSPQFLTEGQKDFERLEKGFIRFGDAWSTVLKNSREEAREYGSVIRENIELTDGLQNFISKTAQKAMADIPAMTLLLADFISNLGVPAQKLGQVMGNITSGIAELWLSVGDAIYNASERISNDFKTIADAFKQLGNVALQEALKVVRAWVQQGVAAAVAKALKGPLPFPLNMAAAAAAGGAAAVLFTAAIKSLKIPGLAKGGVIKKPTLAVVGEYPGASKDPEIIIRQSVIENIFNEEKLRSDNKINKSILLERIKNSVERVKQYPKYSSPSDIKTKDRPGVVFRPTVAVFSSSNLNDKNPLLVFRSSIIERVVDKIKDGQNDLISGRDFAERVKTFVSPFNLSPRIDLSTFITDKRSDKREKEGVDTNASFNESKFKIYNFISKLFRNTSAFSSNRLFRDFRIPAFAKGGVIKKPMIGLIGEYINVASNPEIVAPENLIREIFREETGVLQARVSGSDLLFVLERASKQKNRIV